MNDGFFKIAAATPNVKVADAFYNTSEIVRTILEAHNNGSAMVVFPELCITSYSCQDLFLREDLLSKSLEALFMIKEKTKDLDIISIIGFPFVESGVLYNCAGVLYKGKVLGIVPKKNIPNYSEFYEKRYFSSGKPVKEITLFNQNVPFGTNIIFSCSNIKSLRFGVEIGEDLSEELSRCGGNLILNLSASSESLGKASYRKKLVEVQSEKNTVAYVCAYTGAGESSTDLVFLGHNMICEMGIMLAESKCYSSGIVYSEVDLQRVEFEKRKRHISSDESFYTSSFDFVEKKTTLSRPFRKNPFVPENEEELICACKDVLDIQSYGLAKRLRHIGCEKIVVGVSGGLDSTLALIVAVRTFDMLKLNRSSIIAVTMPGFGTSERTFSNAEKLSNAYGVTLRKISIGDSVEKHFHDIAPNEQVRDIVLENAQARERTQILMDLANQHNAIVVGTGDLSELALGFTTYNGDHMSMYSVNASVPKTLMRKVVLYQASLEKEHVRNILRDIVDTPISPELRVDQKTESIVGPYELNDFFLYYFLHCGFSSEKVYRIAKLVFQKEYDAFKIKEYLKDFVKRFFSQQFKRSCSPDGPRVCDVSFSPRQGFRMPSDVSSSSFVI